MRARMWLAAITLLGLCAGAAAPAAAADDAVQLSSDGTTWRSELARPLFDPGVRWVPGDVRTSSFWVRNGGGSDASLTVTARVEDADGLLADDVIDLELREPGGDWVAVDAGSPTVLGSLDVGADTRIDVRASYPWSEGNDTMRRALSFAFDVRLSGDGAAGANSPSGPVASHDHHTGVPLPNTGNPISWWWLLLAAVAIGGGTALVVRSKWKDIP